MCSMPLGTTVFLQPTAKVFVAVSITALQLSLLSKTVFSLSTVMLSNAGQSAKANQPMLVTLFGILIDLRLWH